MPQFDVGSFCAVLTTMFSFYIITYAIFDVTTRSIFTKPFCINFVITALFRNATSLGGLVRQWTIAKLLLKPVINN